MSAELSKLSEGEGNAKPPPSKRKQCCYWKCNYHLKSEETIPIIFEQIEGIFGPLCDTYIFSEELGSSKETLHIEGYMIFEKKVDFNKIQKLFKWSDLQASTKAYAKAGQKYCAKEGLRSIRKNCKIPKPLVLMTSDKLLDKQKRIADKFKEDEDPLFGRKVYWFWESDGEWGKSICCKYMVDQMGATIVEGANNDVLFGIASLIESTGECPRIVIFDIPRVNEGGVSYQAIEKLKNGMFFSPKYESGMCRFNSPHLICFANEPPKIGKLSKDRWIIEKLVKCNCENYLMKDEIEQNRILCPECGT